MTEIIKRTYLNGAHQLSNKYTSIHMGKESGDPEDQNHNTGQFKKKHLMQ